MGAHAVVAVPCPRCATGTHSRHRQRRRSAFGHVNIRTCVGGCGREFRTYEIGEQAYGLLRSIFKVMEVRTRERQVEPRKHAPPVPRDTQEAKDTVRRFEQSASHGAD